MRVVDRLLAVGERTAMVEAVMRADSPFAGADGAVDEAVFLELMAQAAAAMNGFRSRDPQPAHQGFLLGTRGLTVHAPARVGDTLRVKVFKTARYGGFGVVSGEVLRGECLLAQGDLKVWHSTEAPGAPVGAAGT